MRDSSKKSPSQIAELLRSGGGVRAVKLILCVVLFAAAAVAQSSTSYRIDTVAGSLDVRDNGLAVNARLLFPTGVAVDGAGNLFIADRLNNRIRKVDSAGTITTVAGSGKTGAFGGGFSGDGGPAAEALLNRPTGVAVDGAGNLFIADRGNHRIRKVDSAGTITTVAGSGETGAFGGGFSGDGGPATEALLAGPEDVAVDGAGNLFIADWSNYRIRKVDSAGTITTMAGTGESGFSGDGGPAVQAQLAIPTGVAVDGAGNLFIADTGNYRIRKVNSAGTITTVAGSGETGAFGGGFSGDGGPATEALLGGTTGVAVDGAGNLFIADWSNNRIRKVDSAGVISTVAGGGGGPLNGEDGGPAVQAALFYPRGVAVDGVGNLFIADTGNHRIRKVDSVGTITTVAGTVRGRFGGDGGPAAEAQLAIPTGVAVDGASNLFIADLGNHAIRKVDSAGTITTIAGSGEIGIMDGGFSGDGGPATEALLSGPEGVTVDGAGNVYFADKGNHRIRKVDSAGTITTVAGTVRLGFSGDGGPAVQAQLAIPTGVAVDGAGNVYFADLDNHRIRKVDSAGTITTIAGSGETGIMGGGFSGDDGPAAEALLRRPEGVAVDGAGNLFIADRNNHRIRKVDSAGTITTMAGTGESGFSGDGGPAVQALLRRPTGVAVDGAGNVYFIDSLNHRIRKVDSAGTITTIAGSGETGIMGGGFSGDGGPAAEALLRRPTGVAVDGAGNVYFADTGNQRIRKLTPGGSSTPPNPTGPTATLPGKPPVPTVSARDAKQPEGGVDGAGESRDVHHRL